MWHWQLLPVILYFHASHHAPMPVCCHVRHYVLWVGGVTGSECLTYDPTWPLTWSVNDLNPPLFGGLYKNMDQYDRSDNLGARIKVSLTKIRANRLRAAVLWRTQLLKLGLGQTVGVTYWHVTRHSWNCTQWPGDLVSTVWWVMRHLSGDACIQRSSRRRKAVAMQGRKVLWWGHGFSACTSPTTALTPLAPVTAVCRRTIAPPRSSDVCEWSDSASIDYRSSRSSQCFIDFLHCLETAQMWCTSYSEWLYFSAKTFVLN